MNKAVELEEIDRQAQEAIREARTRMTPLDDNALDLVFRQARSFNGWNDEPVTDEQIKTIYSLMKMGCTSANVCPIRIKFLRSEAAKQRLAPILFERNRVKTMQASAVAVLGYDHDFYEYNEKLTPFRPTAIKERMTENPQMVGPWATLNGALQSAFLIMAIRAVGLDAGPMQGLDKAAADEEFWAGTNIKTAFVVAFGRGNENTVFRRLPRFEFDEACELL